MNFKYIMVDIWGRSKQKKPSDDKITDEVIKIIKDEISNNFNLVNVDPGEIVVFGDKSGKLKTSNLSLDDLLTKSPTAKDNSIVVFKAGKLDGDIPITDLTNKFNKIGEVETDLDNHMKDYKQFRRNVVAKFFGNPLGVTPGLAEVKRSLDDLKQDITAINSRLGVLVDPNQVTTTIENIKQEVGDIIGKIIKIKLITDKITIPRDTKYIYNIPCVVGKGTIDFVLPEKGDFSQSLKIFNDTDGIYRFTIISGYQFNIELSLDDKFYRGINTVLFKYTSSFSQLISCQIKPVDKSLIRESVDYIIEFITGS